MQALGLDALTERNVRKGVGAGKLVGSEVRIPGGSHLMAFVSLGE